jgi:hypothetical protein
MGGAGWFQPPPVQTGSLNTMDLAASIVEDHIYFMVMTHDTAIKETK